MSITPSKQPLERLDGQTIVVRARSRHGRLIFSEAQIDGQKLTVIIDTGSQVTIGNMALQRSLMKRRMWTAPNTVTIESVTGEKLDARVTMLKRSSLVTCSLDDLAVAFADAHIFKQLDLKNQASASTRHERDARLRPHFDRF